MKLKNFLSFFLGSFLFFSVALTAAPTSSPSVSPEELEFEKMLSELPPQMQDKVAEGLKIMSEMSTEELEGALKMAEELEKKAKEKGINLEEVIMRPDADQIIQDLLGINEPTPQPSVTPPMASEPTQQPEVERPTLDVITSVTDEASLSQARKIIQGLFDVISTIQQKAESDPTVVQRIAPLKYNLYNLNYYLAIINQDNLLKYLFEDQFKSLYQDIISLYSDLLALEPQFIVAEFNLSGDSPRSILGVSAKAPLAEVQKAYNKLLREKNPDRIKQKLELANATPEEIEKRLIDAQTEFNKITESFAQLQAIEKSKGAFNQIISRLMQAFEQNMVKNLESLLKKYDPEALKIKKEREQKEEAARKQREIAEKIPAPYAQPVFPEFKFELGKNWNLPFDASRQNQSNSGQTSAENKPAETKPATDTGKKDEKSDTKKSDPKKDDKKDKKDDEKKDEDKKNGKDSGTKETTKAPEKNLDPVIQEKVDAVTDKINALELVMKTNQSTLTALARDIGTPAPLQPGALAKEKTALDQINSQLSALKNEIEKQLDSAALRRNKTQKDTFLKQVSEKMSDIEKSPLYADVKNLLDIKKDSVTNSYTLNGDPVTMSPDKEYVYFGSDHGYLNPAPPAFIRGFAPTIHPTLEVPSDVEVLNPRKENGIEQLQTTIDQLNQLLPK